jgi:hypothetical protein
MGVPSKAGSAGEPTTSATPSERSSAGQVAEEGAADRLAESREHLRDALLALGHPRPSASLLSGGIENLGQRLQERLRSLPMATAVLEGVRTWWQRHPLRQAGAAAEAASERLIAPVARRNPGALILIAVGTGVLLAYAKPWRLLLRPAIVFGTVAQIGRSALTSPSAKASLREFKGSLSSSKAEAVT